MITPITNFKLLKPVTKKEACDIFLITAPIYQDIPGLFRKCYILSDDGGSVGGIYLWKSRAQAEAMYTESWRNFVREKYGTEPTVTYFDTPVVVDNVSNEIITA